MTDDTHEDATIDEAAQRPAVVDKFWAEVEIDPVEIALPSGVGLTLRHYRTVLATPEIASDEDDIDDVLDVDEDVLEPQRDADSSGRDATQQNADDEEREPEERDDVVFLAQNDKVLLFRTEQGLLDFITSDAPHDLAEIDSFGRIRNETTIDMLQPKAEDVYELDLVVKNLRGSHDEWDSDLIISAGEIARDIGQACDIDDINAALSPGSPLDNLDDALRNGGFWARRRLRKMGSETAALAWRGIIGKITNAVQWRE